jgi:hypothetical protein
MSNYYYDEKRSYLEALNQVGANQHDLTAFLKFGLRGIAVQANRLAQLIKKEVSKQIFRNLMHDLFVRLESTRKRVIVKRQLVLLEHLLDADDKVEWSKLRESFIKHYASRKAPANAMVRDVNKLSSLGAISVTEEQASPSMRPQIYITVNLDWPTTITETEFFNRIEQMPISKTTSFLLPS